MKRPRQPARSRRPQAPRPATPDRGPSHRERAELLPFLGKLWSEYVAADAPPALDRWLSRRLGSLEGMPRATRLWLGARLTDGVRWAWLALICQEAIELAPAARSRRLRGGVGPLDAAWARLKTIDPAAFYFWIFLRSRDEGENPPRIDEPNEGALTAWHRFRQEITGADAVIPRLLWNGLAENLASELEQRAVRSGWSSEDVQRFLARQSTRPPLWLRLADPRQLAHVQAELQSAGFRTTVDGEALGAVGERGVFELPCWREGRVEIQDLASQAIGRAVGAERGHFVWDACAGGGGKSLQLAAVMQNTGAIYATDVNEHALADLRKRARRAELNNLRAYPWQGEERPDFGSTIARRGGFDRVLVDAPCSGSGTWRRNPDGRLHTEPDQLDDLLALQARLLDLAAAAVRPGGRLIYATCSWFERENEAQAEAFLARQAEFAPVEHAMHGNPGADADTTFTAAFSRSDRELDTS